MGSPNSPPTSVQNETCDDGVDNDRNGLVDENCRSGSENITKLVEDTSRVKLLLIIHYLKLKIR